jgi:hypothetical protein
MTIKFHPKFSKGRTEGFMMTWKDVLKAPPHQLMYDIPDDILDTILELIPKEINVDEDSELFKDNPCCYVAAATFDEMNYDITPNISLPPFPYKHGLEMGDTTCEKFKKYLEWLVNSPRVKGTSEYYMAPNARLALKVWNDCEEAI